MNSPRTTNQRRPSTEQSLYNELCRAADPVRAKTLAGFFKTGPGEYGEGDVFLGVTVPALRKIAREARKLPLTGLRPLLASKIHEERLLGGLILVDRFQRGDEAEQTRVFDFYLRHRRGVNNWDLVDLTAPQIVGAHLLTNQSLTTGPTPSLSEVAAEGGTFSTATVRERPGPPADARGAVWRHSASLRGVLQASSGTFATPSSGSGMRKKLSRSPLYPSPSLPRAKPRGMGEGGEGAAQDLLDRFARSTDLWERRIAIVATLAFIRQNRFDETLRIARILLHDPEDLIHKAVGWMLREVGKRNVAVLERFLHKHHRTMPRTMLRYAIERFPERRRQTYLRGEA